jgi:hypothetical protein
MHGSVTASHAVTRWTSYAGPLRIAAFSPDVSRPILGSQVSADSRKSAGESLYALELHVRGVIHIQAERLPPVIGTLVTSVISAIMAWLAAGGVH